MTITVFWKLRTAFTDTIVFVVLSCTGSVEGGRMSRDNDVEAPVVHPDVNVWSFHGAILKFWYMVFVSRRL